MTTIRDELADSEGFTDAFSLAALAALGIDPDWPKGSIVVTQRPKCPTCDGEGWIAPTGHGTSHGDEGDPCDTCNGTGYVPDEWATVDRCLTWLRERGYLLAIFEVMLTGDFYVCVAIPSDSDNESGPEADATASTFHAALVAVCQTVQKEAS